MDIKPTDKHQDYALNDCWAYVLDKFEIFTYSYTPVISTERAFSEVMCKD